MITLLKLGGSLITNKNIAHQARTDVIRRLGEEIAGALREDNELKLIIGHGSGSFGHMPARKYHTRQGVQTVEEWRGFAKVHAEAAALNQIVLHELRAAGLPCLAFTPLDQVESENGLITNWDTTHLFEAIRQQLIPVVFGDTVFDSVLGGTIASTEDLFVNVCENLKEPSRILLAGLENGVWLDFPQNTQLLEKIDAAQETENDFIRDSVFPDVTGGMREKVRLMKELVLSGKTLQAFIFSGMTPGNTLSALKGQNSGTMIYQGIENQIPPKNL